MKVLVTGSNGFIAKNLILWLKELKQDEILEYSKNDSIDDLKNKIHSADFVFHLAGSNRPKDPTEFKTVNADLTQKLVQLITETGRNIPVVFSSSTQAELANPYGESKKSAEDILFNSQIKESACIYRLPNVFGKWCKPNYNSVVATFCNNILNGLPVTVHDPSALMKLVYVDDVVTEFIQKLQDFRAHRKIQNPGFCQIPVVYTVTVGELLSKIQAIQKSRENLITEPVGVGFDRALHATYLSYMRPEQFSYTLVRHADPRGVFVEFLKTKDSGQFSFFTAHPGITRGGHYHHSKTEKFLVLQGKALFKFRNVITDEFYQQEVSAHESRIVETVPGWSHDLTNTGDSELVVMLWANEIFDREKPDTIGHKV
jgi:UDP-2-acetamido-2,6-beta-L-arabino-hexul-4-ose reductase